MTHPDLVLAAIHACSPACCSEADRACLDVTVDVDGTITDVAASEEGGLWVDVDCARDRLLGGCTHFSDDTVTICASGV